MSPQERLEEEDQDEVGGGGSGLEDIFPTPSTSTQAEIQKWTCLEHNF